ncbi:MAG: hypothetical protein R3F36_12245 [Candidatus Competibacteraceae bacterium]
MKFRILLSITLALATINGAIIVYRFLRPPPPSSPTDQTPTDQSVLPVAQPSNPDPDPDPDQTVPVEKHAMLSPPLSPRLSNRIADRVLVEKNACRLTLFHHDRAALGRQPVGAKQFEGDNKTPEGHHVIDFPQAEQFVPPRLAHLLSRSPRRRLRRQAKALGRRRHHDSRFTQRHGGRWDHCIDCGSDGGRTAVTNNEIEERQTIPDGTPIEIRP